MNFFNSIFDAASGFFSPEAWAALPGHFESWIDFLRPYSTVASLLLLTGIVYCFFRLEQIIEETHHVDVPPEGPHGIAGEVPKTPQESRWERITAHIHSDKESDWRLGILEADVMLDELVTHMGYRGDSVGEKLKGIERSDFTTLDKAWEAHGVRNRIAHEGASFALPEREAKRIIQLYEEVFNEFKYI